MTCPAGTTGVTYRFSGSADPADASNFRNNGTATNVAVRLYKDDGTTIAPGNSYTRSVRAGTVTEAFKTAMYSNGLALPGTVSSTITINMTYQ
jgi:minor fimbrial subunit